jgi:tetratricopeptide (TPR) repeat protein
MRRLDRITIAALAYALAVPATVYAGFRCPAQGGSEWREYRSTHFVVQSDAGRYKAELLVHDLERIHALELQALVGEQVEIPGHLRVIAFVDPGEFADVAPRSAIGFFRHSQMEEPMIVLPIEGIQASPETVAHEMAHHLSRFLFLRQPRWFAEGLALFVQTVATTHTDSSTPVGTHIVHGERSGGRAAGMAPREMSVAAQEASYVPVHELLRWEGELDRAESAKYHLASWILYHWLWNDRSKQFSAFQQRLMNGEEPRAALRAEIPELDPDNRAALAKVDDALQEYRRSGRYLSYRVSADADGSFTDAGPIGSADVHMLMLDAGYHGNDKERLSDVNEALAEDATQPTAIVLRAAADKSSPLAALRKSVAARPGDWRAWFLLGNALDAGAVDEREAAYRKAAALNPDSAWAQDNLARHLLSRGRAKEALPFANRALDLIPSSPTSMNTLAAVAAALGKCKEALVLQRRASSMVPPKQAAAEDIRRRLADYEARCGSTPPAAASLAPAPAH